ncbi:MAG: metallophosphoesterase [Myxococcota bacterium]
MRLTWATDIHLNFVSADHARDVFCSSIRDSRPDAIAITGDIAEAPTVRDWLTLLADALAPTPIYFVLGNHDYYHGSIPRVRKEMADLNRADPRLRWMGEGGAVFLDNNLAVVGHGGWGDARLGDFMTTTIRINDHRLIKELCGLPRENLMMWLQNLGQEGARSLQASIQKAIDGGAWRIIVLTHVPPFQETCWHEGATPADDSPWLPDFTCGAVGDMLMAVATKHPDIDFQVLCGHSHGAGIAQMADNLTVRTGGAEYRAPAIADVLTF